MSDIQIVQLCDYCSLRKNPDREAVLNRRGYWLCQECADNQLKAEIESDIRAVEYHTKQAEEKRQELLEKQRNTTMPLMTAAEARKRSGKTVNEYLEQINRYILEATEDKKHFIILRGEYDMWMYRTPTKGSVEEQVIGKLRAAGYIVELHYIEEIDCGMKISWEK